MKTLPAAKEDDRYYGWDFTYETLVATFEVETLLAVSDDDYQGDTYMILARGDERGLLIFGWGSCSGCDALQACYTREQATELRDQLWNSVRWEASPDALAAYLTSRDDATQWYGREETWGRFKREALALLG